MFERRHPAWLSVAFRIQSILRSSLDLGIFGLIDGWPANVLAYVVRKGLELALGTPLLPAIEDPRDERYKSGARRKRAMRPAGVSIGYRGHFKVPSVLRCPKGRDLYELIWGGFVHQSNE